MNLRFAGPALLLTALPVLIAAPPAGTNAIPPLRSVEEIAITARASAVTVLHAGRNGAIDGTGTGFVVSEGLIATSFHVIGEARPLFVQLADGKKFDVVEIHAWDRKLDLAVLRIAAKGLKPLPLGDSGKLAQGAAVVAIGNPLGLRGSVVAGVVSAKRDFEFSEMIQVAIPVEPGNSGGPLLDLHGHVQGVMTLKSTLTPNLGFAMPVNALKPLLAKPNPVPMSRWLTIGALNAADWLPIMEARWSQRGGRILVEGAGKGFGGRALCLSRRPVPSPAYEVAVMVKLDDEAGAAGLAFAADGAEKHYGFYPTGGKIRLTRFDGPTVFQWSILREIATPHYRPGEWNALKIRHEKGKIFGYVNGQLVMEVEDEGLSAGKAGLSKFRNTKAEFKQFQMADKLPSAPAPAVLNADLERELAALAGGIPPSPSLLQALQKQPDANRALLHERAQWMERQAGQLRQMASAIHQESVQTELLKTLAQPEEKADLFHAALLLSKLENASLDFAHYRRELDEMAAQVAARLPKESPPEARLEALSKFLFAENGFHGSRSDYYNRANSYLNEVMDDREGIPITLAVLYMEIARRIGVTGIAGIPLPGHFIVEYRPKGGAGHFWIDVYDGGKKLNKADAAEIVRANTGGVLREDDLKPATKREIIVRMLRNLIGVAARSETPGTALRHLDLLLALAPDAAGERLNRALLRAQSGDKPGAKEDVTWLLDHQAPGLDADRLRELYRSLGN
jgi:regulator of sirC expression with transglutaminase-like and TPR domain